MSRATRLLSSRTECTLDTKREGARVSCLPADLGNSDTDGTSPVPLYCPAATTAHTRHRCSSHSRRLVRDAPYEELHSHEHALRGIAVDQCEPTEWPGLRRQSRRARSANQ